MKNTLTYSQGIQSLLANMNDGTNRILINGVEIPSSDWTGTGTFAYSVEGATISIQRIADTSGNIMLQKVATDSYRLVRKEESSWQTTTGDTKDNVTTFTSSDVADGQATAWTSVVPLESGEKHSSIFAKVSQMFKNIRYLFKMLGTTDISSIGDGSVTSAISALNVSLANKTDVSLVGYSTLFTPPTGWSISAGVCYRIGNLVYFTIGLASSSGLASGSSITCTDFLPASIVPIYRYQNTCGATTSGNATPINAIVNFRVDSNSRDLYITNTSSSTLKYIYISMTYICA